MSLLEFRRREGAGPDRCAGGGGGDEVLAPPQSAAAGPRGTEQGLIGLGTATWSAAPMERAAARLLRGSALVSALAPGVPGVGDDLGTGGGGFSYNGTGEPAARPGWEPPLRRIGLRPFTRG